MRAADVALIAQVRADLKSGRARELRKAAGIHQGEVAAVVGVSRVAVSQWEAGAASPTTGHALAYGRLLQTLARRAA
jgi:transcriptional regulator with XRE-family HTH domain